MSNIAILLGASEYTTQTNIPACSNDIELMQLILHETQKYDEIFVSLNATSAKVKQSLPDKIEEWQQEEIEEVFFYFTGHGTSKDEEFYYILADYQDKKLNQTTFSNTEIDELLRSLKPSLAIKVVDACESGLQYIKDTTDSFVYIKSSIQKHFEDCYFMFSSSYDQNSGADRELSFFTRSFAEAIMNHDVDTIRYRDIKDFITDFFQVSEHQQVPRFVMQGDNTEIFTEISLILKQSLEKHLNNTSLGLDTDFKDDNDILTVNDEPLVDQVIKNAEKYVSEEQVLQLLNDIQAIIESHPISKELEGLFEIVNHFAHSAGVPEPEVIGRWLSKNTEKHFFAHPVTITKRRKIPDPYGMMRLPFEQEYEEYEVISGYESTTNLPYNEISIYFRPSYPNLMKYKFYIVLFFSYTDILLFTIKVDEISKNWQEYMPTSEELVWTYEQKQLINTDDILETIEDEIKQFEQHIIEDIRSQLTKSDSED